MFDTFKERLFFGIIGSIIIWSICLVFEYYKLQVVIMSMIEKTCRVRTFKCKHCNCTVIVNPDSVRYHKNKNCKNILG